MAKYAFLLGCAASHVKGLHPLRYTVNDVEAMKSAFSTDTVGFTCVYPKEEERTPGQILAMFERQATECRPGDSLLFYFSGHGYLRRGQLFLILDNSDLEHPVSTALPIATIKTIFANTRASVRMMVLDCCHSGAAAEPIFPTKSAAADLGDSLGGMARDSASLILAACGRTAAAREVPELELGFLTHLIIRALTSDFNTADRDRDRLISIQDLIGWIGDEVNRYNQDHVDQPMDKPELYGELRGDVFLTAQPLGELSELQKELLDKLNTAIRELQSRFEKPGYVKGTVLQRLARPMKQVAATFTDLSFLDDLFKRGDDASLFAAATILQVRRDPRYMYLLIPYIDTPYEQMRGSTNWRILRAVRDTLSTYRLTEAVKEDIQQRLQRAARIRDTRHGEKFERYTTLKMILQICKKLKIKPEKVFTSSQLSDLTQ